MRSSWLELSPKLCTNRDHLGLLVLQGDDRSKRDENLDLVLHLTKVVSQCRKHLASSLRVASITYFVLSCHRPDEINLGCNIILAKLEEAVVEEFRSLMVGVDVIVLPRVDRASVVSKPDVISCVCQNKGWRIFPVHNPPLSRREKAMLEEYYRGLSPLQFVVL